MICVNELLKKTMVEELEVVNTIEEMVEYLNAYKYDFDYDDILARAEKLGWIEQDSINAWFKDTVSGKILFIDYLGFYITI